MDTSFESDALSMEVGTVHQEVAMSATSKLVVAGIGAAEGGDEALLRFFTQMPLDEVTAFLVMATLPAEHLPRLAEQIRQTTAIAVDVVSQAVPLKPNHIYLLPQEQRLVLTGDTVSLSERTEPFVQRSAIDLGLRSLAEIFGRNAIAIILSGEGSDGALGLPRIKELGGLTLAQQPGDATFDAMPRAAIATGFVDYVLPAAKIPAQILAFRSVGLRLLADPDQHEVDDGTMRELFVLLRIRTGHDFSNYKRTTIMRRIGRRMMVNGTNDVAAYLMRLREQPEEVQLLLRDLLISVTNFFRDAEAFHALETLLPSLFASKGPDDYLRVWVAGCATGEEAYSVAILLAEYAAKLEQPPVIQLFATDIDEAAIMTAREGFYRSNIAVDVIPERLRRYFSEEQGGYRIKKEIRDRVLFASHNLLRDPPFSRLDLVTCRNVLIYLDRVVQERLIELFHFVLRPDGGLVLGSSESADSWPGLFTVVDKRYRIYTRRSVERLISMLPPLSSIAPTLPRAGFTERMAPPHAISFGELHQRLLELYGPPSLVVNEAYEIVHLSSQVGRFLRLGGGEPSHNLLKIVHPDLRREMRTLLFRATQKGLAGEVHHVRMLSDGQPILVNLTVRPVNGPDQTQGFLLVLFEAVGVSAETDSPVSPDEAAEPLARQLDEELQRLREQLRLTIEQFETSTEELKASNEELQAMNEELRSATEELETSKEELQAVNEELTTVNQELKNKVDELSRVNADLQNLMASTDIGTIFLDRELRVKRYTPRVQEVFNLIATDINRPLAHVTHHLGYHELLADAARVIDRLTVIEREVQHLDGRWFLTRLLPYRTSEDRINGVVLTFVDITKRKLAEESLQASKNQLEVRVIERTADLEAEVSMRRQSEVARQALIRQLVGAQEEERRKISREIHDQLGQQLTVLLLSLHALKEISYGRNEALSRIDEIAVVVNTISQEMRQMAQGLRPTLLDDLGLVAALANYAEEWGQRTKLRVAFHSRGLDEGNERLPAMIETTIYRVVLEALLNVVKHAEATQVSLIIERRGEAAVAIVEDNGQGFDAETVMAQPAKWGLGLLGIRERIDLVGGTLTIESTFGMGTTIFVRVPITQI